MYGNNIDRLRRQKEEIDALLNSYQQAPVNNIINTQPPNTQNNLIEWRVLNENEQVDNLYVSNKTLFINDKNMVLKGVDGSLEKWDIKKTYPIDLKDQKINELENKLKEMEDKLNEYSKLNKSTKDVDKSNTDVNEYIKPTTKTNNRNS